MNLSFIAIKLFRALITLWLVVTFAFVILRDSGDPIEILVGDEAEPEVIEYYTKLYGLDKPMAPAADIAMSHFGNFWKF